MLHLFLLRTLSALDPQSLLAFFLSLGGVAALVTVVINILKQVGVVKDGQSANAQILFNAAGFVGVILLSIFNPDFDFASADATAGSLAQILVLALGLVGQFITSKGVHAGLRGLPVIGKSFSPKK